MAINRPTSQMNRLQITENQFPEDEIEFGEFGPGGPDGFADMPQSNYDQNDLAILYDLWSIHMNVNNRPQLFNDFITDSFRFGWWPNGRLSYANIQKSDSGENTPSGQFLINQLPDNFGNLTEVYYVDIGLGHPIPYLPESMGNMFQASKFELVERNGGFDSRIASQISGLSPPDTIDTDDDMEYYNYCKDFYNSLKYYPDPEYEWSRLKEYSDKCTMGASGGKTVGYVNLHLDGAYLLGPEGTIPDSIGNWSHLEQIFWGIGMDDSNTHIPDVLDGWTKLRALVHATGGSYPQFNFPHSFCTPLHNFVVNGVDWINNPPNDMFFEILLGPTWNSDTCNDYLQDITIRFNRPRKEVRRFEKPNRKINRR